MIPTYKSLSTGKTREIFDNAGTVGGDRRYLITQHASHRYEQRTGMCASTMIDTLNSAVLFDPSNSRNYRMLKMHKRCEAVGQYLLRHRNVVFVIDPRYDGHRVVTIIAHSNQ